MDTKLHLLIQPIPIEIDVNEINKYFEEIRNNGGYDMLMSNICKKSFCKDYTKNDIQILKDNLENLKRYVSDNSSESDSAEISIQEPRAVVFNQECLPDVSKACINDTSASVNEIGDQLHAESNIAIGGKF